MKFNIKLETFSDKSFERIIIVIGLLIAFAAGFMFYTEQPYGDEAYYYRAAGIIKAQPLQWLSSPQIGVMESFNAIVQGYSMLLPGNDFANVFMVQIFIFALTGLFIYRLSRMILGKPGSLIVVLFYLVNNKHWMHVYNMKPGLWINFLLVMCVYLAFKIIKEPEKVINYLVFGLFTGLMLLTDMRYIPHLMFMYLILLFVKLKFNKKLSLVIASGVVAIIVITPWVIRQSVVYKKFILISDLNMVSIDMALKTPKWQRLAGYEFLADMPNETFEKEIWNLADSLKLTPGELIYALSQANGKKAASIPIGESDIYTEVLKSTGMSKTELVSIIERNENKPYIVKLLIRTGIFWEPFQRNYVYVPLSNTKYFFPPASLMNNANRFFFLGILLPFLLPGLWFMWKSNKLYAALFLGILLLHTIVHVLTYIIWRYMLPILPILTLIAVYGLKETINHVIAIKKTR